MSVFLPDGTKFYIGSTYSSPKTFTSISNAAEAVASFAADPSLAAGDVIEITSGWEEINGNVYRVKAVAGAGPYLVTIEGLDTTDTARFAAGAGAGTVREVTAWTEITQVESPNTSGGEMQFLTYQTLAMSRERRIPTYRSAQGLKLTVFDDPALAWYATVQAASVASQTAFCGKAELKSGAKLFFSGYWSLQEVPTMESGQLMKADIDVAYFNTVVRYAS